ncbi:hypothetical protein DY000_02056846 [Brassica cretica]|uniref:Armadillo repeat-containing domain-containing protein n=1 Tax=Brassica cretica TaxID=69181 RepID=A0ABQ7ADC5_BRACR|nr:hypothetical protein DY000_02056846 [Brassica cretica]
MSNRGLLVEAGVVPALVDLFRDGDEKGKLLAASLGRRSKDIAEDVFCILAVAESNVVFIAEQLVRILREGDNEAKFAASVVLWDLAGYRHFVSVIRDSGVIPLLVELVRDGSLEFRERISGTISQLCYNENDRTSCPGSISSLMNRSRFQPVLMYVF